MTRKELPAALEARGDALVRRSLQRLADRAGDADAAEQLLLGADLAQPFVVRGGQRLARDKTGAGVGDAEPCRLIHGVVAGLASGDAGDRRDALLGDAAAVLQGERGALIQRHRLAQRGAEPALLLRGID